MALKHYNPKTPGLRGRVDIDRSGLYRGGPVKALTVGLTSSSGRNSAGRVTSRHRGGRHRRSYRLVDFCRSSFLIPAVVERLEYDPNRSAFIALVRYANGIQSYILAPLGLEVGDEVVSGAKVPIKVGNAMLLKNIPPGTNVHNIELNPGSGGVYVRSAGTTAQLSAIDGGFAYLKLPSGEMRIVSETCMATIGIVSNIDHRNIRLGKAGRSRWLGIRSKVRGVAMNPVDHPHGGGEGATNGGRNPVSIWGKPTKGKKTRKPKYSDRFVIRSRHDKKKGGRS